MYIRRLTISIFKTLGTNSLQIAAMKYRSAGHVKCIIYIESYWEVFNKFGIIFLYVYNNI